MTSGIARLASRGQLGLRAPAVSVEVHLAAGLPNFSIVGLAETAVKESKERVRSALENSGFEFPAGRITVNLSPADMPKEGGRFDLPIALGILLASGQLACATPLPECFGELALNGELRGVSGLLVAAAAIAGEWQARVAHARACTSMRAPTSMIVPAANLSEVGLAAREARGAEHLLQVCAHLRGELLLPAACDSLDRPATAMQASTDLTEVRGQILAKRALCIAAAGAHSLLLIGPPGSGKSMLAQRLPELLPPLDKAESMELAAIAAARGLAFDPSTYGRRPFRSPHHTTSAHAMIGGGRNAQPGEVTLAHHGVLFLDELPEFDRRVLEALREPLETGVATIARADWRAEYPASFQLIAAMNPCPCGHNGDATKDCRCSGTRIANYRSRLSGPLLDRIDLRVELAAVPAHELLFDSSAPRNELEVTAAKQAGIRESIAAARERQLARCGTLNAKLGPKAIEATCVLEPAARRCLANGHERLQLTARGFHRTVKVAQTIADLEGVEIVRVAHIAEALQLRRALEAPPEVAKGSRGP